MVAFTATAAGADAVSSAPVSAAASATVLIGTARKRILFYGPTAGGLAAATPGISYTVWDEAMFPVLKEMIK